MIEVGLYKCGNFCSLEYGTKQSDVSSCFDFTYDDCFDEHPREGYPKCYLKSICFEKTCERFN
jgi:hypothetical protein